MDTLNLCSPLNTSPVLLSPFFSFLSPPTPHAAACCPDPSPCINPSLHLPLIHSQAAAHPGIVLQRTGFVPTRGSVDGDGAGGLCSYTFIWPWRGLFQNKLHENRSQYSLSLGLTGTFHVLIFHGLITLLCAKVNFLLYCPALSTVVAGCRETANTAIHSYPSMKETGRKGPRLSPPTHPTLFNHTEPYGCTVCCIN